VTGLGKDVWVAADCPNLERFECYGGPYGSGSIPLMTDADISDIGSFKESFVRDGRLEVAAGRVPFTGLSVPDTCVCVVPDFFFLTNSDAMRRIDRWRNAGFESW